MSKVKCYTCHKMGHYAGQCPHMRKKHVAAFPEVDDFISQFDGQFCLSTCLASNSTVARTWYIDSGATCYMSGVREHFSDLIVTGVDLYIEFGNESKVKAIGRGIVSFQRESRPPMVFNGVLYVPGLKKNLISVSTIEDQGYVVTFQKERVLVHPKGSNVTLAKVIGIRQGKMYRLDFQPQLALASCDNNRQLVELWHKRLAHLHHGDLY